jgi:hypothetical protein
VRFKSIFLLLSICCIGCSEPSPQQQLNHLVLKQNRMCLNTVKSHIKELLGSKKVFLSHSLFADTSKVVILTQRGVEGFGKEQQLHQLFLLQKEDENCYVGLLELFKVKKREAISCECIVNREK